MQELKWKVPLPHEQRDINDKEGTCETARPGGRALLIARAGEDTRPYGKTGSGSFFFVGAGHWPARGRPRCAGVPPLRTSSASLRSAPIPIPSGLRPSPLEKGSRPLKGKAEGDRKGRPYGGMRTGSVCSVKPGAEQKPHRLKFWGSQGPVARTQIATQILRAGNTAKSNKYASPVMGVLGGGRHGGGRLCRTADCARPLAVLW